MSIIIDTLQVMVLHLADIFHVPSTFAWPFAWFGPGIVGIIIYYLQGEWDNITYYWDTWFIDTFQEKGRWGRSLSGFLSASHSYFFEDDRLHLFRDKHQPIRWWWFIGGPAILFISFVVVYQEISYRWKIAKMEKAHKTKSSIGITSGINYLDEIPLEIREGI